MSEKKEWITVYEISNIDVEIWRHGVCDKCGNQGVPVVTFSHEGWTTIDLCFDCLEKAKEELLNA